MTQARHEYQKCAQVSSRERSFVATPGMYQIAYRNELSQTFKIGDDVFDRHGWQPTLEYFLLISPASRVAVRAHCGSRAPVACGDAQCSALIG